MLKEKKSISNLGLGRSYLEKKLEFDGKEISGPIVLLSLIMGFGLSSPERSWGEFVSLLVAWICEFRTKSGLSGGFLGGQGSVCSRSS